MNKDQFIWFMLQLTQNKQYLHVHIIDVLYKICMNSSTQFPSIRENPATSASNQDHDKL